MSHLALRSSFAMLALCAAAALKAEVPAAVTVAYPADASAFTDAGQGSREREANLQQLSLHLQNLGKRWLPAGQQLQIDITDLDLAGRVPPISRLQPAPRVLKGSVDWPRIALRYSLTAADGTVVSKGEESLSDMNYLQRPISRASDEPLAYEKRLLTHWFEQRFARPAPP